MWDIFINTLGGYSVHGRDFMSTLMDIMIHVGYIHKYTGRYSVHGRDFMNTSGSSTMSTLMDIMIHINGFTS